MASGVAKNTRRGSHVQELYTSEDENAERTIIDQTKEVQWDTEDTKFLVDKLKEYLPMVGPSKVFKTKKLMYEQISTDILDALGYKRTYLQCENRYKTIMKRKNHDDFTLSSPHSMKGNKKLKKEHLSPEYVLPEADESENFYYCYSVPDNKIENEGKREKKNHSMQETMLMIHQMKEENKERRHQEKMELLRELIYMLKK